MQTHKMFIVLVVSLALTACSADVEDNDTSVPVSKGLTEEQRRLAGIQTGALQYRLVSSVITCTGEIEVPPQGMASVTAPLGGYLMDTDIVPGKFVKKGTRLAILRNPDYVVLQQSYLETISELKFAEQDYSRQKLLQEKNATAAKKYQESESSFNVLKARLAGLKEQLRMIGIDINHLERGEISSVVSLRAPLTGYVTKVNHHPGQFVDARDAIFQIVNMDELHLHLNIFEKDVARVRKGHAIRFRPAGAGGNTYTGQVSLVSPQSDGQVRTFDVHAHIDREDETLKPGMYVEAEILVEGDSVYALKEAAVVRRGNETFVLTQDGGDYQIVKVDTGTRMDGWIEIRNPDALRNKKIVTEGASRLFTILSDEL